MEAVVTPSDRVRAGFQGDTAPPFSVPHRVQWPPVACQQQPGAHQPHREARISLSRSLVRCLHPRSTPHRLTVVHHAFFEADSTGLEAIIPAPLNSSTSPASPRIRGSRGARPDARPPFGSSGESPAPARCRSQLSGRPPLACVRLQGPLQRLRQAFLAASAHRVRRC